MTVPVTPGSGKIIASDLIGTGTAPTTGQDVGYVKVDIGNTGASSPVTQSNPFPTVIADGTIPANRATVTQFHNADNQSLGAAYGIYSGGVAQLLSLIGNLDRQRETGADNISAQGISTGTQQLKSFISTTLAASCSASATSLTLAATKFTNNAAAAWIQVGTILTLEPGTTNQETVRVSAVNYGTNVVTVNATAFAHANSSTVYTGAYNEARDATTLEGTSGTGIGLSATTLFNASLNGGSGGWENERSASGELDNASGKGTAVAAEYCFNGISYDRERNLQGKGLTQATITSTAGADTTLTFSADPSLAANGGLKPGTYLLLSTGLPTPLVGDWVQVSSTYTSGTSVAVTPVGLTTSITAGRTRASFSTFATSGPGVSGFIIDGVSVEEECVFDPVSGLYFIERSATQDGVSGQNVVMESPALLNASGTMDREYNANGDSILGTVLGDARNPKDRSLESEVSYLYAFNGTAWQRLRVDANNNLLMSGIAQVAFSTASFTRPANTTTYAAGQVVANATSAASVLTFTNCGLANGGVGFINSITITDIAVQTLKPAFQLWLFNTAPTTTINDAQTWNPSATELNTYNVPGFPVLVSNPAYGSSTGGNLTISGLNIPFKCGGSTTSLYGVLVILNAYVPVSSEAIQVTLGISY